MRIGVNTLLWTGSFGEDECRLLPWIKASGFDLVEISRYDFDDFPASRIRSALESEGLGCTFCSALTGTLNLAGPDPARAFDFLRKGIELAAELGAPVLSGPFCTPVGYLPGRRRTEREWAQVVDHLRQLGPVLDQHGVNLALEAINRFECYFVNTAEDLGRLVDDVGHPRIGVLFDTFHANIEEKDVAAAVTLLGCRIRNVHAAENDRGAPGSGHVPWEQVFTELRAVRYDGPVVIESFGGAIPELAAATCIWRDLARDSDTLALDGLAFLRTLTSSGRATAF